MSPQAYKKAALQGNPNAQFDLGESYLDGKGVIKDELEGIAWIYVASTDGNKIHTDEVARLEGVYTDASIAAARARAKQISQDIANQTPPDADSQSPQADDTSPPPSPLLAQATANGSGAFLTSSGYVLTAAHVIKNAKHIQVISVDGKYPATIVSEDDANDLAILKCDGDSFTPLPMAPSGAARLGQTVFTIGFPNVDVQGINPKVTKGEISSISGLSDDDRFWQISVPIQPGNSGGPLCDTNGNLLGIIDATLDPIVMAKEKQEIPQNVNFAIKDSCLASMLSGISGLPSPKADSGAKFEDVIDSVRKSTVLILILKDDGSSG
jgi:S1-C subfamily serine protease